VTEARELLRRAAGSMWTAPIYARIVELAEHDGDIAAVRRAIADARELMRDFEEHVFYARELYLAGLRAEADAAQRARAARDGPAEDAARTSGLELAAHMRALTDAAGAEGSPPRQVIADIALIDAELARLEGRPSEELWRAAARENESIGNLIAAAYARLHEAEAQLESGVDASEALMAAHSGAAESGAHPLREACEQLARRARISLGEEPQPVASSADDPFGLTAREREVLVLVAAGRTNRQIGEELFMSEKTASVHVSRILAKLEVSTRGEAGSVAHKLGLDG
jgi:DNA-binding NarL/FixJ family response regulator